MRRRLTSLTVLLLACDSAPESASDAAPVADIVVRPAVIRLRSGEAAQLAAQANDSNGRPIGGADLAYTTTTPRVVRVSPAGAVSAVGPVGDGLITVASGSTHRQLPVIITAGAPSAARVESGGGQSGEAGTTLPAPVVLVVTDAFGNPVPRTEVRFEASAGGVAEPATATTDPTGFARTVWTLGTIAGPQTLHATAGEAAAVLEASAVSGRMAAIEAVGELVRRVSAGDTVPVRLRVTDRHGNGVSGAIVAFSVRSGGGAVAPTRIETGADGLAQTRWVTGTSAGLNALAARTIDVRDTTIQVDVRTFGGPAASVVLVRGNNQRGAVGRAVAVAPSVRVNDRYGNAVSAARVRFVTGDSGVVEPPELVTDDSGRATVARWVLGRRGENVLRIVVDGVTDTLRVTAQGRPR